MPYVTEQLKFNLRNNGVKLNNRAVTSQPPLVTFDGAENKFDFSNKMENMVLLARRDIRLGNASSQCDLDFIPVKEAKAPVAAAKSSPVSSPVRPRSGFRPSKCLISIPNPSTLKKATPLQSRPAPPAKPATSLHANFTAMIDTLYHAVKELNKPVSNYYPDSIEEDRLQRRVEEQRRHLCRMLYNTKRQVRQLIELLERTPFNHRGRVIAQTSTLSHLSTAYRSLMSALGSFTRVAHSLQSNYMSQLKKKVRGELRALVEEMVRICRLLDIPTNTLQSAPASPVPRLNITENLRSEGDPGPVSPERDECLKAAVRSLVQSKIDQGLLPDKRSQSPPQQRSKDPVISKRAAPKSAKTKKVIKPKVSRYPVRPRPVSAAKSGRPLGQLSGRPVSAPVREARKVDQGGQVTPYITEKELARDPWLEGLHPRQQTSGPRYAWISEKKDPKVVEDEEEEEESSPPMSTTMVDLLEELRHLEREDEAVRSRWLHGRVHEHGPERLSTVLPSATLLHQPPSLGGCQETGTAHLTLSPDAVAAVRAYRGAMEQYLRRTKHFQTERFNPWATLNQITAEIVDGVVEEVMGELGDCCDGLASTLYLSEFMESK